MSRMVMTSPTTEMPMADRTKVKWIKHHDADLNEYCAVQGVGGVGVM